jgi:hypothetical protein
VLRLPLQARMEQDGLLCREVSVVLEDVPIAEQKPSAAADLLQHPNLQDGGLL